MIESNTTGICSICVGDNHGFRSVKLYSLIDLIERYPILNRAISKRDQELFFCRDCLQMEMYSIIADVMEKSLWFKLITTATKNRDRWITNILWGMTESTCAGCGAGDEDGMIIRDVNNEALFKAYGENHKIPAKLMNRIGWLCPFCLGIKSIDE